MSIENAGAALLDDLVTGNRILASQGVVDAFGHLSCRHDKDPDRYLMSRHLAPKLVTKGDLVAFDLDSEPWPDIGKRYYSERFIHGEIYKARKDVKAIVHCHAPALIPFGVTEVELRPVYHLAAFLGLGAPVYDIRAEAGMTDMLVRSAELARSLAEVLGTAPAVLMRGHGATFVGSSIRQVVHRAIYATVNAHLQMQAQLLGDPKFLGEEEASLASVNNDNSLDRAWDYWVSELT